MKLHLICLALLPTLAFANSDQPMVDGPSDEQVIQSIEFKGAPGVTAKASMIKMDENSEISLTITHQKPNDVRHYMILDNDKLGLTHGGMAGTESSLDKAANGSLLIKQQNDSVGRNRFERSLTVSYRGGKYVVTGFTYSHRDTLDPNAGGSCDYNLVTGSGKKNLKPVKVKTKVLDLAKLEDTEKMYSCDNW